MSEQNDKRKTPYVEESPSWQFPKVAAPKAIAPAAKDKEPSKRRLPAALFKGKLRTSTLVLVVLYVLLDVTKKPIPAPEPPAQPWAPPTNAVFGTDGNWTVPAQIPTTQRYYPPPAPQRTSEQPKPSSSETPSTSESSSESESTSERTRRSGSSEESEESNPSSSASRSHRSSDVSSPSPSPTAESGPTASSAPRTGDQAAVSPPNPAAAPTPGKSPAAAQGNSSP